MSRRENTVQHSDYNTLQHTAILCSTLPLHTNHYTPTLSSNPPSPEVIIVIIRNFLLYGMKFESLVPKHQLFWKCCTFMSTRVHTCISTCMHRDTCMHSNQLLITSNYHLKSLSPPTPYPFAYTYIPVHIHIHIHTHMHSYVFTRTHA